MMQAFFVTIGLVCAVSTFAVMLWSIVFPARRIWPPKHYTAVTPVLVWAPTLTIFGTLIALGVLGWGDLAFPNWARFGLGLPLICLGNLVVWFEVAHFGVSQTGGAKGTLRTARTYRYSRNPQYVADIAIVVGWIVLSASASAALVGLAGIAVLIAAPFAEEPWLKEQYGSEFQDYASKVRRFI